MKKLTCIFFAAILFVSAGCKKSFFDINQNPNLPTEESLTPELIIPRALARAAAKTATSYANYAGYMGYWSRSGTYGPSGAQEGYTITSSFEADEWNDWYDILYDFDIAEKKATESGQNFYVAIAKIMKTIGFMYLVDQYNNVAYTEAFDVGNHITPAYDNGPAIYADLIAQLNTAIELLGADGVGADASLTASDIVYGGNATLWRKLANTQKLKLLIHEASVVGGTAQAELAKTASVGYLSVVTTSFKSNPANPSDEGAYVQPGYVADNLKQNPFWDTYDTDFANSPVNDFWRLNNFILKIFNDTADPRLGAFFDAARTPLGGALYAGTNYGEVVPNSGPQAINQSDVSGPGISVSASQAQWFFTVTESLFLQAEAAQRGWISGSAEELYNAAVSSSFIWLGLTQAQANTYLAGDFANWDANAATNKVKLIATQKYIALTGINNFEGWVDYRRLEDSEAILTGSLQQALYSFSPQRNGQDIPLRLIYAQSEYNYNAANVEAQGRIDPQNNLIFWDAKKR